MSLNKDALIEKLRAFMDAANKPPFEEFPETVEDAQKAFAAAIYAYTEQMSPTVLPPVLTAAKETMASASLTGMGEFNMGIDIIKNAINTYALQIAAGMPGYVPTAIPAPGLPLLENIRVVENKTAEVVAGELADLIHNWFIQWKSTQSATPFTVTPWS